MPDSHARLSPSAAHRWLHCPAALAVEQFEPETTSLYAEEGTRAHALAEHILGQRLCALPHPSPPTETASAEMFHNVTAYTDVIWALAQQPGAMLRIEQRCDFSPIVGIPDQFGTADAIILTNEELQIHDLKYGYEKVEAFENPQLMLYALGALRSFSLITDIRQVKMVIHQPLIGHVSEYTCSIPALDTFGLHVREQAGKVLQLAEQAAAESIDVIPASAYQPSEKACRWCKRRGKCPAQWQQVAAALIQDFDDLTHPPPIPDVLHTARQKRAAAEGQWLGDILPHLDFIEAWCKDVRMTALNRLQDGEPIPGYKLVQGRQGNRAWLSEPAVITLLKETLGYPDDQIYTFKVISPAQAKKWLKKAQPQHWKQVEALITRSEGKPTLAPEADPKPTLTLNPLNDFDLIDEAVYR